MSAQRAEYRVVFDRRAKREPDVLAPRVDFKLDDTSMERFLGLSLEPMSRDLARVGMAIFVADRLARRRNRQRQREVALQVAVSEPDFWGAADTRRLIETSAEFLGDDCWTLSFSKDESRNESDGLLGFRESPPAICLYSGGLDSAAGLATRLRSATGPVMAITAWHQAMQRRMVREEQIGKLRACYGADVQSLIVKTHLLRTRWPQQEHSQRCRSMLFMFLAGAVACSTGAPGVEVYENGVGVINVPPMTGMLVGARSTRGCHPYFLRLVSDLVSKVAGHPVVFRLPYQTLTKAELVRTLKEDALEDLAQSTFSCVHYPLRRSGPGKQCGTCMGCIGRRQALLTAGISDPGDHYACDLFGDDSNCIFGSKLDFLTASITQLADLDELRGATVLPQRFAQAFYGTKALAFGESWQPWAELLLRYRTEWSDLLGEMRRRGVRWARWLDADAA